MSSRLGERVLVGEKEYRKGETIFASSAGFEFIAAPATEEQLAAEVGRLGARAVVVGMQPYTGALYRALEEAGGGRGALIARFGVGHENVDKVLARAHGCTVCNTPGALDVSVAEHTLWLIGASVRGLAAADASMRAGAWASPPGVELRGKRLGIIGFGRIAQRVAAIAHFGFGMCVEASGRSTPEEWAGRHGRELATVQEECGLARYTTDATAILAESDFVSLHLPASAENRHFIDAARLALMQPHAILVNTARGSVLDEAALYDALEARRIGGAALDVFQHEPYRPVVEGKDLRTLENVLLTPHIGSNTAEANRRMAEMCVENLRAFFEGNLARVAVVR